jgi:hypothetical protein
MRTKSTKARTKLTKASKTENSEQECGFFYPEEVHLKRRERKLEADAIGCA